MLDSFTGRTDDPCRPIVLATGPPGWPTHMLAKLASYTLIGIEAAPVEVEVDVSSASMP